MIDKKEFKGEITIIISNIFFAVSALFVKIVPDMFDGFFISFFRFVIGILLCVFFLIINKTYFKVYGKLFWTLRGLLGAGAMTLYFISIQITSSGRATLVTNIFPIFVVIFAFLFFKEKIYLSNIISILLCIIGLIFVFYDGSKYPIFGDLLALSAAILAGLSVIFIKKLRADNNSIIVYLPVCIFGLLLTSFSAKQVIHLNMQLVLLLIFIGIAAFLAQVFMTYGFKYVSSTKGSIITFSKIPMTIGLSLFIGEEFKLKFIIGTVLIIAGLIINRK